MQRLFFPITSPPLPSPKNINSKYHARTKHIDVCFHFIRWIVEDGKLQLIYCPTEEMVADVFTKALVSTKVKHFARELGLVSSWGGVLEYGTPWGFDESVPRLSRCTRRVRTSITDGVLDFFLSSLYCDSHLVMDLLWFLISCTHVYMCSENCEWTILSCAPFSQSI